MTNHPRRVFISFSLLFDPSFTHFNNLKGIYGMPVKLILDQQLVTEPSGTWRFVETTADILHIIFSFQPRKAYYTHQLDWSQVYFESFMCAWVACGNYTQCKSCTTGWIFHYPVRDSAKKRFFTCTNNVSSIFDPYPLKDVNVLYGWPPWSQIDDGL